MPFRLLFAIAALFVLTTPLRAEEIQLTFSGIGECSPGNSGCTVPANTPFSLSFDLNTLSGAQAPLFGPINGVSCLQHVTATGLTMTSFSGSIGGQNLKVPNSGAAAAVFDLLGGSSCTSRGYEVGLLTTNGFDLDTSISKSLTQAQYQASNDPLLLLLSQLEGDHGEGSVPGFNLFVNNVEISGGTPVPEPETWAMLLPALFGLGLVRVAVSRGSRRR